MRPPSFSSVENETLMCVLATHFERTKNNISWLINGWSSNGADLEQCENAVNYIFRAVNQPREEFVFLLEEEFGNLNELSEGMLASHRVLKALSQHSTGNVDEENDLLFRHCSQVSSLEKPKLQWVIADYLKGRTNEFLQEQHPEMYQQVKKELAEAGCLFAIEVANDFEPGLAPSTVFRSPSPEGKLVDSTEEKKCDSVGRSG